MIFSPYQSILKNAVLYTEKGLSTVVANINMHFVMRVMHIKDVAFQYVWGFQSRIIYSIAYTSI